MKPGPKCSCSWRRPAIRLTIDGVVGWRKSVSPGADRATGVSKSISTPSNPYSVTMLVTELTKFGMSFASSSLKYSPPPPSEIITFLPWLLSCGDVRLQLLGGDAARQLELHRALRSILVRRSERDQDHVPLRRDLVQRKRRSASCSAIRSSSRSADAHSGHCVRSTGAGVAVGSAPLMRAMRSGQGCRRCGERVRIRKAIDAARRRGCTQIPGQQRDVLQVIGKAAGAGRERRRGRKAVLRIRIRGLKQEVVRAHASAAAPRFILPGDPRGKVVARSSRRAEVALRIVQRIVDELRKLLRQRLDIAIGHNRRRVGKIRAEHKRIAGGGIHAVRPPPAAHVASAAA